MVSIAFNYQEDAEQVIDELEKLGYQVKNAGPHPEAGWVLKIKETGNLDRWALENLVEHYNGEVLWPQAFRDNPSIRLSSKFFEGAIRDYTNWKEKWWREAIQNSVDAGAAKIECLVKEAQDGTFLVTMIDNGKGMSREILLDKFLVLGETTKVGGEGSVGGFGKAKELLILPWLQWEIETQNTLVQGAGADYQIQDLPNPFIGTRITVRMAADMRTTDLAAKTFIRKCYLPSITFTVNGETIPADLAPGEMIQEFPNLKIHYNPNDVIASYRKILIRTKGIFMFDDYADKLEGCVVIEAQGPSINLFTANREGFRNPEICRQYQDFITKLIKDVRSGLRGGSRVRKIYRGGKKFSPSLQDEVADDLAKHTLNLGLKRKSGQQVLSEESITDITNLLNSLANEAAAKTAADQEVQEFKEEMGIQMDPAKPALIQAMLDGVEVKGDNHLEALVKQLVWEPDFFLCNEIKDFAVPAEFYPETMSPKINKLARLWAELCRFVLIQLGCEKKYGIGFIFSYKNENDQNSGCKLAMYARESGENWLLFNPHLSGNPAQPTFDINDDEHLDILYAYAVHECTHMSDDIAYHDEDFAAALTHNMAKTFRGRRNLRSIREAIVKSLKTEPKSSKIIKGRGFYKVSVVGQRGRASMWMTLQEARDFIDNKYQDKTCRIDAFFKPEEGDPLPLGTAETRYLGESRNIRGEDTTHSETLDELWERFVDKNYHLTYGMEKEDTFRRNPNSIESYLRSIKNSGKRAYARAYLDWLQSGAPEENHPNYNSFGISYMGAQAVRLELAEMGYEESRNNPDEDLRNLERKYQGDPSDANRDKLNQVRMRLGLLPVPRVFLFGEGWQAQSILPSGDVISSATASHDGWWGISHGTWHLEDDPEAPIRDLGNHLISSCYRTGLDFKDLPKPTQKQVEEAHQQVVKAAIEIGINNLKGANKRWSD